MVLIHIVVLVRCGRVVRVATAKNGHVKPIRSPMATILRVYSESTRFLIHVRDTTAVVNRMETVYGLRIVDSV